MGNYLETLKNISKDKKKEKLIYILVLCVVLFVSISYIFNDDKKEVNTAKNNVNNTNNNNLNNLSNINNNRDIMEEKLAKILSQISGIEEVSVMITYNNDGKINPIYNIKQEEKDGLKSLDKSVVYNEQNNEKKILIETTASPTVEGVIVVAKGANNIEIKSKIAGAVSAVTNVAVYKIQVFEKKG